MFVIAEMTSCLLYRRDRLSAAATSAIQLSLRASTCCTANHLYATPNILGPHRALCRDSNCTDTRPVDGPCGRDYNNEAIYEGFTDAITCTFMYLVKIS